LLFGTHLLFNQAQDSVRANPNFLASLTSIPIRSLRFPGGTIGDNYLWREEKTARSDWFPVNYKASAQDLDFDEFMTVVKCLGGQASIVLNLRYWVAKGDIEGGIKEAEDWVNYANKQKGYGVRYWEFGNEEYFDTVQKLAPMSGAQYGKYYAAFRQRLKAIDPSIELGMVMPNDVSAKVARDNGPWWDDAMKGAQGEVDYVVIHRYVVPKVGKLLRTGSTIGEMLASIKAQMHTTPGKAVPIHLTEWNIGSRSIDNPNIIKHDTVGHALFVADAILDEAEQGVRFATFWPLLGPQEQGLLDKSSLSLNAPGEVMKMMASLSGWSIVKPQTNVSPGLQVSVFKDAGKRKAIVAINWTLDPQTVDWKNLAGDCPATARIIHAEGETVKRRSLFGKIVEGSSEVSGGSYSLPGLSVAVIMSSGTNACS
jgi:hypothetical protein